MSETKWNTRARELMLKGLISGEPEAMKLVALEMSRAYTQGREDERAELVPKHGGTWMNGGTVLDILKRAESAEARVAVLEGALERYRNCDGSIGCVGCGYAEQALGGRG